MAAMQDAAIPRAYRATIRRRLAVPDDAARHSLRAAARHGDLDRQPIRTWRERR